MASGHCSTTERFWASVRIGLPAECWEWQRTTGKDGYGLFSVWRDGRRTLHRAHRFAKALEEPIPDGMWVLHHCDNRKCCNPAHLYIGTALENNRDTHRRGRTNPQRGENHYWRRHPERIPRGERKARAVLTESDVRTIRRLRASGLGPKRVAAIINKPWSAIWCVMIGRSWRHVTDDARQADAVETQRKTNGMAS